jgi:hypothetical protein
MSLSSYRFVSKQNRCPYQVYSRETLDGSLFFLILPRKIARRHDHFNIIVFIAAYSTYEGICSALTKYSVVLLKNAGQRGLWDVSLCTIKGEG